MNVGKIVVASSFDNVAIVIIACVSTEEKEFFALLSCFFTVFPGVRASHL